MSEKGWEHFYHEADIGVRGWGETLGDAFAQAGMALTAVVTDPAQVVPRQPVPVRCVAPDDELLLADWLNALVFEMATRGLLFSRFEVEISDHRLVATAWGEYVDPERHQPAVEIKGATYTELRVYRGPAGSWLAQAVVDV